MLKETRARLSLPQERRIVRAGVQLGQGKPQTIETRPGMWCINNLFREVSQ